MLSGAPQSEWIELMGSAWGPLNMCGAVVEKAGGVCSRASQTAIVVRGELSRISTMIRLLFATDC